MQLAKDLNIIEAANPQQNQKQEVNLLKSVVGPQLTDSVNNNVIPLQKAVDVKALEEKLPDSTSTLPTKNDSTLGEVVRIAPQQNISTPQTEEIKQTPAEQVIVKVKEGVQKGQSKITVHLEPASLGNIDVVIDLKSGSKAAQIVFMVEKPETLDLLQKDSKHIEKLLSESGLQTDSGSLDFNMKQQSQDKGQNEEIVTNNLELDEFLEAQAQAEHENMDKYNGNITYTANENVRSVNIRV